MFYHHFMSRKRNDPTVAKLRRERIRRQKQTANPPPALPPGAGFASERSMRDIHALLEGQEFSSTDDLNAKLMELTRGGRVPELAAAWKQDDPKWQAQQLAYDALETDDFEEALRLTYEAQKLDPDCVDARRLMVSLLPVEESNRLHLMREVISKAEENLGKAYFEEHKGHFWSVLETRPYMRALLHLAELQLRQGHTDEAIASYQRMVDLNERDNQGMRYRLLGLYLSYKRLEDANRLFGLFPGEDEFTAMFAWGRVLERWLSGGPAEAESALAAARKANPHAERYICGAKALPENPPDYYGIGDESEAQVCAIEMAGAWLAHPEFRKWLRAQPRAGGA